MEKHSISEDALARFATNAGPVDERRAVMRHLLAGCEVCREYLARYWPRFRSPRGNLHIFEQNYDAAFDRALRQVPVLRNPRPSGLASVLARLDRESCERQELLVRNSPAYRQPEVCDELIERCYGARFQDAGRMLHQATLAVLIAEGLTTNRRLPPVQVTDRRARAWTAFGNSLRVGGDLNAADQALTVATFHLRDSSGGVLLQAEVLAKLSSLRYDQRRFDESFSLAAELARIWRKRGDTRELCRALVKQAIAAGEAGYPQKALTYLEEAEELLDSDKDPQLLLFVRHNKVHFLIDAGQLDEGQDLYSTIAPLYEADSDPLLQLKGRWLTGQLLSAIGEVEESAELLSSVHHAFLERGNEYEAAQVALALADASAKLGRRRETKALAREAFRVLREHRVGRDALASLILLESASGG